MSLSCRFNLRLLTGKAPEAFRHGITVLVPKTQDGLEPKDYRPITMGSILCRLYHKDPSGTCGKALPNQWFSKGFPERRRVG